MRGVPQYHIQARTRMQTSGMLASAMRTFIPLVVLAVIGGVASMTWLMTRGPTQAQSARIDAVLRGTAPADEPAAYAHCASCHLHDGSGRPDGSIPRLAGQRRSVLENKLYRLRAGMMRLPVMDAFARTLAPKEIAEIAGYLSGLPELAVTPRKATGARPGRVALHPALRPLSRREWGGERWVVRFPALRSVCWLPQPPSRAGCGTDPWRRRCDHARRGRRRAGR